MKKFSCQNFNTLERNFSVVQAMLLRSLQKKKSKFALVSTAKRRTNKTSHPCFFKQSMNMCEYIGRRNLCILIKDSYACYYNLYFH